jgi:hypothetical protein
MPAADLMQLVATLRRRARQLESHRRRLPADRTERLPIAGNLAHWPYDFDSYDNWLEFEIDASEGRRRGLRIRCARKSSCCPAAGGCW